MAINPLISLQSKVPDIGATFSNALTNIAKFDAIGQAREQAPIRNRLLEAQTATTEAAVPSATSQLNVEDLNRLRSVATGARSIVPDLQAGNVTRVMATLQSRRAELINKGAPTEDTDEALRLIQSDPNELMRVSLQAIAADDRLGGLNKNAVPFQFGSQETLKDEKGNLFLATGKRNPATGKVESVISPVGGGNAQPSGRLNLVSQTGETAEDKLTTRKKETAIDITKAREIEFVKKKVQRASEITKELSTRNREAARSSVTLNKALILAQKASQGLSGASKLQLSRLLPGINASDEAGLDAALKQLALVQLQSFKGPTTDFEFGVTQSIAGAIGQSQAANIARIKSLKRASWFNQKEFDQFQKHIKSNGDPDSFRFNFGEPIKTKKGIFKLQDIQDSAVRNNLTIEEAIKRLNK